MKRVFLLVFVTIFDPLTRLGAPTNRLNPLAITIVLTIIGGGAYYYYSDDTSAPLTPIIKNVKTVINTLSEQKDELGRTALHRAARYESVEDVKALLAAGANPNEQDNKGRTPLHMTRFDKKNNIETVKTLLDAGADPNIKNNKGKTPLQAIRGEAAYTKKKQKLLKKYGAE